MRKLNFVLSLIAIIVAAVGVGIAVAAYLNRNRDEYDEDDSLIDEDFDYYEAQVEEDSEHLQDIVDDTHPLEHGAEAADAQ